MEPQGRRAVSDEKESDFLKAFQQWITDNSYAREVELSFVDCDRNKNVRPAKLLSLVAAAGGYDYDARGLTHQKLYEMGQVFLLSGIALRIHRRPVNREVLTITTWEDGVHGAHMRRVYEITDESGAVCVSAKSEWILIDPADRKILRPASFTGKPLTTCPKSIDCPDCRRITLPREGTEMLGTRLVRWSDLDGNGHVYSGNYGDIVWDVLPADLQGAPLRELYINYSREALLGETLTLQGFQEGNSYTVEGRLEEGHCFSCRCEFDPD